MLGHVLYIIVVSILAAFGLLVSYRLFTTDPLLNTHKIYENVFILVACWVERILYWIWALAIGFGSAAIWSHIVFRPFEG